MAKAITQRITLDGGTEFRTALQAIGETGQQAFKSLSQAVTSAQAAAIAIAPSIDAIQKKFSDLKNSAHNVGQSFDNAASKFKTAGTRLGEVGAIILGVQGGFAAMVVNAGRVADEINRGAASAGLGTTEFQGLRDTFGVLGVESDQFTTLINKMNKTFGESVKQGLELQKSQRDLSTEYLSGKLTSSQYLEQTNKLNLAASQQINVFNRLGISATTAANNPKEAFLQLIDAFSRMPAGIAKSSLELEVFGRKGSAVALVADQGRAAFEKLTKQIEQVAPPLTKADIAIGTNLIRSFRVLQLAVENIRERFFLAFGPGFTQLFDAISTAIVNNRTAILDFANSAATALQPLIDQAVIFLRSFTIDPALFDSVKSGIVSFVNDVKTAIGVVIAVWDGFVAVLQVVADAINKLFGTDLSGRALAFAIIIGTLTGIFGAIAAAVGLAISLIGFFVTLLGGPLLAGIAAIGVAVGFVFGQLILATLAALPGFFQAAEDTIKTAWAATLDIISGAWTSTVDKLKGIWTGFVDLVLQGFNFIKGVAQQISSGLGVGNSSDNAATGRAGGGIIRGPGTSTSDSIRALLSNGEFVIKTKAVQHYGAGFFAALNNMRLPREGFALGGLVDAMDSLLPRRGFASGGLVNAPVAGGPSGRPVVLKIGDQTFGPLIAGEETVTRLERFAANKQVRSMGRKPSWAGK